MSACLIAIEYCVASLSILRLVTGADIVLAVFVLSAVDIAALPHVDFSHADLGSILRCRSSIKRRDSRSWKEICSLAIS